MFDRRELLRRGIALGLAPALIPLAASARAAEAEAPRVRRRVPLGKTGLELSDIGFGSSSLAIPTLTREMAQRSARAGA
jgi:hypothetical protein